MEADGVDLTQLRRGVLQHCVLALIEDEARYSYDLVTALGDHAPLVTSESSPAAVALAMQAHQQAQGFVHPPGPQTGHFPAHFPPYPTAPPVTLVAEVDGANAAAWANEAGASGAGASEAGASEAGTSGGKRGGGGS